MNWNRMAIFVALVALVAVPGCQKRRRYVKPKPQQVYTPPPPAPVDTGITINDTGPIVFFCTLSTTHEEKEVEIANCPKCSRRDMFYQDPGGSGFFCFSCKANYPNANLVCPDCKTPARRPRLKHR